MSHEPHHLPVEHEQTDSWHRHAASEGTPQEEHASKINPVMVSIVFFLTFVTTFALIAVVALYANSYLTKKRVERVETTKMAEAAVNSRNAATQALESYGWVNQIEGTVRVPIDQAMDEVVKQYGGQGG